MCGIIGMVSQKPFSIRNDLLAALKRLEYRGYDSVGYATNGGELRKDVGQISKFVRKVNGTAEVAIAHTRWATHGGVSKINSHPHTDCSGNITIVHNGIIENAEELKKELKKHHYKSQTDSEVIAHYFEEKLKKTNIEKAIRGFFKDARGTFAILLMIRGDDKIYALKRDSPLVLGIGKDRLYLASDIYSFSNKTNKAIFFEDEEYAIIDSDKYNFYDSRGNKLFKEIKHFEWSANEQQLEKYPHYMIKEIMEEPIVAEHLIHSLETDQKKEMEKLAKAITKANKVMFLGAGTSYNAAYLGNHMLNQNGFESHVWLASEFDVPKWIDKDSLIFVLSQSGETMDLIEAIKHAKEKGAKVASLVNVPFSTVQRMSDISINIMAGQEICVAATKSYINQCITLLALASMFRYDIDIANIPGRINQTIKDNLDKVKRLAEKIYKKESLYVLGRGVCYSSAAEIALKIKEISYIHAEGMRGGEIKHGAIALISKGVPVISLIPLENSEMINNTKEIEARKAHSIRLVNKGTGTFNVPESKVGEFVLYSVVVGQLLAYFIAKNRKLPIDKPRNLAKSVTVK